MWPLGLSYHSAYIFVSWEWAAVGVGISPGTLAERKPTLKGKGLFSHEDQKSIWPASRLEAKIIPSQDNKQAQDNKHPQVLFKDFGFERDIKFI